VWRRRHFTEGLLIGLASGALIISCAHVPPDKALIEVKNGDIYWIDRVQLSKPGDGPFEINPGGRADKS
jgi:hypothetical protein